VAPAGMSPEAVMLGSFRTTSALVRTSAAREGGTARYIATPRAQLGLAGLGHLVRDGVPGEEAAALLRGKAGGRRGPGLPPTPGRRRPRQGPAGRAVPARGGRPAESSEHGAILGDFVRNMDEPAHPGPRELGEQAADPLPGALGQTALQGD